MPRAVHSCLYTHDTTPQPSSEVVARLLNMPHRADWKDCALSVDEETKMAADFKKLFAAYDWSLKDD